VPDFLFGWIRIPVEQLVGHENEPRRAESALKAAALDERLLHWGQPSSPGKVLNSHHLGAVDECSQKQAARDRIPVDQNRATATKPLTATFTGAEEAKLLMQEFDQIEVGRNLRADRLAIERKPDRL